MGVFAPWFLFGLAALGVPLYLHLLRRNASTPRPFSSLRFFEPRTMNSVRHRRLRYLLLLALRLALVALVVLAFANPFVNRPVASAHADRLLLLLIDHSFSMHAGSRLEDARRAALAVLAERRAAGHVQVMSFSSQLQVLTSPTADLAAQRAAVTGIEADDSRGNLSELVSAVRQASGDAGTPIEVHLFSDLQQSNLPSNFAQMSLPDSATLVLHPVSSGATPNWTIEGVTAPDQIWGNARDVKPARVQAIVAGYATPTADRSVSLLVNGRSIATQRVHVPAGGRVTVNFDNLAVPYGLNRCEVRIDAADVLPQDDGYRFAVEHSDPRQVLFVHAPTDARSPLYFGNALAAADGSAFIVRSVSEGQAANLALNPYVFVVLSNVAGLPQAMESALVRYVRAGGSVLVALGTGAAGQPRVPVFDGAIAETRDYSGGFANGRERYLGVGDTDTSQAWVGSASLWSGVKFFYALHVDEANAQVLARLSDRTPLLLEKQLGEGRVLLLASGLEGLTNDLPLHPAFVALVEQLARHLASMPQGTGARVVDAWLPLHTAEERDLPASAGVEVIDPAGQRPLSLTEAASIPSLRLSEAGFYQLRLANGRQQLIGVNVDPRESDLAVIPEETLALLQHARAAQGAAVAEAGTGADHRLATAPLSNAENGLVARREQPYSLWWFIMLLALAAALAEAWVANRHLGTQRDEP